MHKMNLLAFQKSARFLILEISESRSQQWWQVYKYYLRSLRQHCNSKSLNQGSAPHRSASRFLWTNTEIMETPALVLGAAQVVVQVSGVIRRHVNVFSSLSPLPALIESKATRTPRVANRLSALAGIPGLSDDIFLYSLRDLENVRDRLQAMEKQISWWKKIGMLFFQAPVRKKSFDELNSELTLLDDHHFRTISSLSTSSPFRGTKPVNLLYRLFRDFWSLRDSQSKLSKLFMNLRTATYAVHDIGLESKAEFLFAMRMSAFDTKPKKARIVAISKLKAQSAAGYFNTVTNLGKRGISLSWRHLLRWNGDWALLTESYRDILWRSCKRQCRAQFALGWCHLFGHGVEECPEMAVELYQKAINGGCGEALAEVGFLKLHADENAGHSALGGGALVGFGRMT